MRRIRRIWLAAIAATAATAACGGGYTPTNNGGNGGSHGGYPGDPGGTPAASASVDVNDDYFSPNSVVVAVGGTVTWHWVGHDGHSVTPSGDPSFSPTAPVSYPPKDLVVTFPTAGTYYYYCLTHGVSNGYGGAGTMVGTIVVR